MNGAAIYVLHACHVLFSYFLMIFVLMIEPAMTLAKQLANAVVT